MEELHKEGPEKKAQVKDQLPFDFFPEKKPTLENFIAGSNVQAAALMSEIRAGAGPQFAFLWGAEGVGKTHLLKSLVNASERVPEFNEACTLYSVDNVQSLSPEEQQKLFALYNAVREHSGTHLVVAADESPKELERKGYRKDLTSRFAWGVVLELNPLSDAEKREVIISRASQTGLKVAPEVLNWIENNFPRDMHTMSDLLHSLDRYAMSAKRAVTIPLIKEWLEQKNGKKENL